MKYEIVTIKETNFTGLKATLEDGAEIWIPADEGNTDYQAYLAWKAEQPTPKAGK